MPNRIIRIGVENKLSVQKSDNMYFKSKQRVNEAKSEKQEEIGPTLYMYDRNAVKTVITRKVRVYLCTILLRVITETHNSH